MVCPTQCLLVGYIYVTLSWSWLIEIYRNLVGYIYVTLSWSWLIEIYPGS